MIARECSYLPLMLVRADRGGDLGGVLHHSRVRGPGRVRPHPQDDPGPQAAGDQEPEGEEGQGQEGEGGHQGKL